MNKNYIDKNKKEQLIKRVSEINDEYEIKKQSDFDYLLNDISDKDKKSIIKKGTNKTSNNVFTNILNIITSILFLIIILQNAKYTTLQQSKIAYVIIIIVIILIVISIVLDIIHCFKQEK